MNAREAEAQQPARVPLPATPPASGGAPVLATPAPPNRLRRILSISAQQYLARHVHYVGTTGAGGIALLVFALAFFLGANLSLRGAVEGLQATLADARQSPAADASPRQMRARSARELVSSLPERSALPEITGQIVAQAQAAGLALDRGSYDLTVTHSGQLVRARMTFPVHGRYTDIRRFIDSTLATVPGAAVDGLRLQRKDIGAAEIDADIRFAVYVRGAP